MSSVILLNKPFHVLSQFVDSQRRLTLASFLNRDDCKGYYAAGRLDYDSEGLLVLTNDGALQNRICAPSFKLPKTYWAQVEGVPKADSLQLLRDGVALKDGKTSPASVVQISAPEVWPRHPPIRERKLIPTSWLEITISEGKNRQVRRMTAAAGLPTLRLIRKQVGPWSIGDLQPGDYRFARINLPKTNAGTKKTRKRP